LDAFRSVLAGDLVSKFHEDAVVDDTFERRHVFEELRTCQVGIDAEILRQISGHGA
jgi:hypothetical protein